MMFYVRAQARGDQLIADKNVELCQVRVCHNFHLKSDLGANYAFTFSYILFYQIALMSLLTRHTWQNSSLFGSYLE